MNDPRPPSPEDTVINALLCAAVIAGALVGVWWLARPEIVGAALAVADGLLAASNLFTDRVAPLRASIAATDPGDPSITFARLWGLMNKAAWPWSLLAVVLLGLLAWGAYRKAGARRFTRRFDLDSLMVEQALMYPHLTPFAARPGLRLVEPRREGGPRPLDPALHLSEWIDCYARDAKGGYDETAAVKSLSDQLGPLWMGARNSGPAHRAMFAAFALHGAREQEICSHLLAAIAHHCVAVTRGEGAAGPEQPLPGLPRDIIHIVDDALADPVVRLRAEAVAGQHAYTVPALMSVLCYARERGGVLNPGLFAFVQLLDRPLFLALDTLGVPQPGVPWHQMPQGAPVAEAMAARDHWTWEREAGHPLPIPAVALATATVRAAAEHNKTAAKG